jgi:two-component system chemotaxis response regulator CheB
MKYEAVVIGASWGGIHVLRTLISNLPVGFRLPVFIAQHLPTEAGSYLPHFLQEFTENRVKEPDSNELIEPAVIYVSPSNYHMLVDDKRIVLSVEEKVNFSRPSIDLLFTSAAESYRHSLIGVILTGANSDGSHGLKRIKELGGCTIVQNPEQAEVSYMPSSAIKSTQIDYVLNVEDIAKKLCELSVQMR